MNAVRRTFVAAGVLAILATVRIGPVSAAAPATLHDLNHVEAAAEAVADGDVAGPAARYDARIAVAAWPAARVALRRLGVAVTGLQDADYAVAVLDADVAGKRALRRDANEVTGAIAPLFAVVGDAVPAAVHRLDYLQRAIALDAVANDWPAARADLASLEAVWAQFRPRAVALHGGAPTVARFESSRARLVAAVASGRLATTKHAAGAVAAGVDGLEALFSVN
ncbi:MAG: hypothetical protein ACREM6_14495 [Vulcanimicrobiaceae bacterium]